MSYYIVCTKKRNNPRMDVRICQKKCHEKDECKAYLTFLKIAAINKWGDLPSELPTQADTSECFQGFR